MIYLILEISSKSSECVDIPRYFYFFHIFDSSKVMRLWNSVRVAVLTYLRRFHIYLVLKMVYVSETAETYGIFPQKKRTFRDFGKGMYLSETETDRAFPKKSRKGSVPFLWKKGWWSYINSERVEGSHQCGGGGFL